MSDVLSLPVDVPWKLISASPDMMDVTYCDKTFPFEWRSSMAIFAYEPPLDQLPEGLCDTRVTMLKITTSITGYEPSEDETKKGYTEFPDVPVEDLARIIGQYWGCWGALLNVAVFPFGLPADFNPNTPLDQYYPHIFGLEPKTRDLYQASTDTAEVLTASKSGVNVGKSQSNTQTQETGLNLHSDYDSGQTPYGDFKGGWVATHQWGETDTDTSSSQADASRESRETKGTTTNISQLYNLLSGYHLGTNRATFLMLPRPHTLQATDHRTFVQGLRVIEGIQEFFLVVCRPTSVPGLSVEARLETGHFPEDVTVQQPAPTYDTKTETFTVHADRNGGFLGGDPCLDLSTLAASKYTAPDGWVIDKSQGDAGSPGVHDEDDSTTSKTNLFLSNYNIVVGETTVQIEGTLCPGTGFHTYSPDFTHKYTVFLRSQNPTSDPTDPKVTTPFLITGRSLCTAFLSGPQCVQFAPVVVVADPYPVSILDEPSISLSSDYLTAEKLAVTRQPVIKQLMRKLQSAMSTSYRSLTRRPFGQTGFLDSDYFKTQIAAVMPKTVLEGRIGAVTGLQPGVVQGLGANTTVGEALKLDLATFARKAGLSLTDAAQARGALLRAAAKQ